MYADTGSEVDYWHSFWAGMMSRYGYAVTGFKDTNDPTLSICESDDGWWFDEPVRLSGCRPDVLAARAA